MEMAAPLKRGSTLLPEDNLEQYATSKWVKGPLSNKSMSTIIPSS